MIQQNKQGEWRVILDLQYNHITDMVIWCYAMLGPGGRNRKLKWRRNWIGNDIRFYFRSKEDAIMFMLRWGS